MIEVAVTGVDIKVYGHHLRMSELKHIAAAVGAKLDLLPWGRSMRKKKRKKLKWNAFDNTETTSSSRNDIHLFFKSATSIFPAPKAA